MLIVFARHLDVSIRLFQFKHRMEGASAPAPWDLATTTVFPFTSNFTPCGSGIGFFPIRDICIQPFS